MNILPPKLLESLVDVPGFDANSFEAVHSSGDQLTSVRINPAKNFDAQEFFPGSEKIPWSSHGYYLPARPSFTLDPLFHAGAYYVQEASSMFLEEAVRQTCDLSVPLKVLDLCASPGGKSTLLQSLISEDSLLVSNELIKTRVNTLSLNITKWGTSNVIVTNNDPKDFQRLPAYFDIVVADAPCSGSGLFRKDNDAITEWSANNVELCSQRQQRILADVLPTLKEGGILIYSTCSYSESENEAVADFLSENCGMKSMQLSAQEFPGITETFSEKHHCAGYRFYPNKIKGEGFFIAAFRKEGNDAGSSPSKKLKSAFVSNTESELLLPFLRNAGRFSFIKQDEDILAIPTVLLGALSDMQSALYIKKAGVKLGALIRGELIPAPELALSTDRAATYPEITVPLERALDYLRRKDITVDTFEKGWALIKYADHSLGFIKILPGRINNYYPKELRILNR
ncbi:MAG: RNA methyltransferase [Ferruginibacter sp.]